MKKIKFMLLALCITTLQPIYSNAQNFIDETVDATPVPVKWLSFEGVLENNKINLWWSTAAEINNSHFNILRSVNGRDFINIGRVEGRGTQNTISSYTFTDNSFPKQNLMYRLEQVDADGTKNYSGIIQIRINDNKMPEIGLFPNPTTNKAINITLNNVENGKYAITLRTLTGGNCFTQTLLLNNNSSQLIQLPKTLQPGNYFVEVFNLNNHSIKMVKQLIIH